MRFAETMAARTDDELLEVVHGPAEDWDPEAVEAAKAELGKRGVDMSAKPEPVVHTTDPPPAFDPSIAAPEATTAKGSMPCPYCRTEMTPGRIEVHGGSARGTFFRADDGGEKEDILEQTTRDAFQCGDCSTLIIKGRFVSEESRQYPYRE